MDMHSDDFMIKSVHLTFGQTEGCPKDALPKLLEWIKPNYRCWWDGSEWLGPSAMWVGVHISDRCRCCAFAIDVNAHDIQ